MKELKFELRKRQRTSNEFWSVFYDEQSGKIKSIEPGQQNLPNCLVVNYARVKKILSGDINQSDFRVALNENLGALDLVDLRRPAEYKKKHIYKGWLSAGETDQFSTTQLRAVLFTDTGHIRFEASRVWSTKVKQNMDKDVASSNIPFFISDIEDPHLLLGHDTIKLSEIVDRGFWEKRLWAFMDHEIVKKILYHGQEVRINMPPVASNLAFNRSAVHAPFTEIIDEKTIISHVGAGKHISVFSKDGSLWAQSHYHQGSAIDNITGNLTVAILTQPDPEYFALWAEMPALMLRQQHPFELVSNWPAHITPSLLYKANNLDIGVLQ